MGSISLKYKSKSGNLTAPGDVDPGAFIPIATTTVGAGGVASVTFSNIPQIYEHLQIRVFAKDTNAGNWGFCAVKFNNLGTSYGYRHDVYGTGSAAGASNAAGSYPNVYVGPTSQFGAGVIDILDYANSNKATVVRALSGTDQNGGGLISLQSGLWYDTAAVTQIDLTAGSSFLQYSSFALYGIKKAGA